MSNTEEKNTQFSDQRRQLLRLGAAGMPMVLTLGAGASGGPLISQLQCVITLPGSLRILVSDSGAAWVGTRTIATDRRGKFQKSSITKFKNDASFSFGNGSAPSQFRPTCSPSRGGDSDSDGDGDGNSNSNTSCYSLHSLAAYQLITPGNYVDANGSWNINGSDAASLYIALSIQQANNNPGSNWAGVSCLVSILNYLK